MSKRQDILRALAEKLKSIDGTSEFKTDISNNAYPYLRFWDSVQDFPCIYVSSGFEAREISELNGGYWGFLNVGIRAYCKGENAADELQDLIDDIEVVINKNLKLEYAPDQYTVDMMINSITTSENLLAPYEIGELQVTVRYDIHREYN